MVLLAPLAQRQPHRVRAVLGRPAPHRLHRVRVVPGQALLRHRELVGQGLLRQVLRPAALRLRVLAAAGGEAARPWR
jgi:hypothetical protein